MKEKVLQHFWMSQQIGSQAIYTTRGNQVKVVDPGSLNEHAGPDFLGAHIMVDNVDLHGHIEIHLKSSDWYAHQHHKDVRYHSVVLHVVWDYNKAVEIKGKRLFTIALSSFLKTSFIDICTNFEAQKNPILCAPYFSSTLATHRQSMLEKALFKRFGKKYEWVRELLKNNKQDSDATAYQVLACAFGFKINSDAFLMLCERAPFAIIKKYISDLRSLEALLFGSAGFLEDITPRQSYLKDLKDRYDYFKHNYKLPISLKKENWRFFKTRPRNFPTIRIAQFARALYRQKTLFDFLLNTNYEAFVKRMRKTPSPYWCTHYLMHEKPNHKIGRMGHMSINSIVINAVVPLLVTYGNFRNEDFYVKRAVDLLKILPAETNHITRMWRKVGLEVTSAFDSQACTALLKHFCSLQACLKCDVGRQILRRDLTIRDAEPI